MRGFFHIHDWTEFPHNTVPMQSIAMRPEHDFLCMKNCILYLCFHEESKLDACFVYNKGLRAWMSSSIVLSSFIGFRDLLVLLVPTFLVPNRMKSQILNENDIFVRDLSFH